MEPKDWGNYLDEVNVCSEVTVCSEVNVRDQINLMSVCLFCKGALHAWIVLGIREPGAFPRTVLISKDEGILFS